MGLSFLKRIRILPWLGINISTGGVNVSAGPTGAKIVQKLADKQAGKTQIYAGKYGVRYTQTLNKKERKGSNYHKKR